MLRHFYLSISVFTIVLIAMMAIFNQPTIDDLYFIHDVKTKGILGSVTDQYNNFSGRYTAYFINNCIQFLENNVFTALFTILIHLLFANAVFLNIQRIPLLEKRHHFLFTLLIYLFFITSTNFATETFFWTTQTITYLLPFSLLLFMVYFYSVSETKKHYPFLIVFIAVLSGGMNEWITLVFILFLTYQLFNKTIQHSFNYQVIKSIGIAILVTQWGFVYFSPGNSIRSAIIAEENQLSLSTAFLYGTGLFAKSYLSKRGLLFLLFAIYFSVFLNNKSKLNHQKLFLSGSILFVAGFFPLVYFFHDVPPSRTLVFAETGLLLSFIGILGYFIQKLTIPYRLLGQFTMIVSVAYLGYTLHTAYLYNNAYAERKSYALKQNEIIRVDPLPQCDLYYEAEITTDIHHYRNQHVEKGWNLAYPIQLK